MFCSGADIGVYVQRDLQIFENLIRRDFRDPAQPHPPLTVRRFDLVHLLTIYSLQLELAEMEEKLCHVMGLYKVMRDDLREGKVRSQLLRDMLARRDAILPRAQSTLGRYGTHSTRLRLYPSYTVLVDAVAKYKQMQALQPATEDEYSEFVNSMEMVYFQPIAALRFKNGQPPTPEKRDLFGEGWSDWSHLSVDEPWSDPIMERLRTSFLSCGMPFSVLHYVI